MNHTVPVSHAVPVQRALHRNPVRTGLDRSRDHRRCRSTRTDLGRSVSYHPVPRSDSPVCALRSAGAAAGFTSSERRQRRLSVVFSAWNCRNSAVGLVCGSRVVQMPKRALSASVQLRPDPPSKRPGRKRRENDSPTVRGPATKSAVNADPERSREMASKASSQKNPALPPWRTSCQPPKGAKNENSERPLDEEPDELVAAPLRGGKDADRPRRRARSALR